jgi:hypothetical protein
MYSKRTNKPPHRNELLGSIDADTTNSEDLATGDVVRLRPGVRHFDGQLGPSFDNYSAAITSFLRDVKGGIYLSAGLRGCRYWNIADVEKV